MERWQVDRSAGHCVKTGAALKEGQTYYTVLFEEGDTFRREDYSEAGWCGPPAGAFCHFKTRMPVKEKKKRLLVDDDVLVNFFSRLADEQEPSRLRFRFVLALILMRKRLLKYDETVREGMAEYWRMRLVAESQVHTVLNPRMTDHEIHDVSRELSVILHADMDADLDSDNEPGEESPDTEPPV